MILSPFSNSNKHCFTTGHVTLIFSVKKHKLSITKSSSPLKIISYSTLLKENIYNSCTSYAQDVITIWLLYFMFTKLIKTVKSCNNWPKWLKSSIISLRKSGIVTVTYLHRRKTKNFKLLQIGLKEPYYQNYFHKLMITKRDKNSWQE